jgi:hypothetical protein
MSVKIVAYDLKKQWHDYKDFINAIKTYKNAKMTDSFWFISTEEDCEGIFRNLEIFLEKDDRLLVQDIKGEVIVGNNLLSTKEELEALFG